MSRRHWFASLSFLFVAFFAVRGSVAVAVGLLARLAGRGAHVPTVLGYIQYLRRIAEMEERSINALCNLVARCRTGATGCYVLLEEISGCPWRDRVFFQLLDERDLYEEGLMA